MVTCCDYNKKIVLRKKKRQPILCTRLWLKMFWSLVQQSNQHFALLSLSYGIAFTTGETLMLSLAFWFSSLYHCLKVLLMQCRAVLQSCRCISLNAFILHVTILRDHTFRLTASFRKCLKSIQTFWSRRLLRFLANETILRKDGISNDCILSQLYNLP